MNSVDYQLRRIARSMPRKRGTGAGWVRPEDGQWVGRWGDWSSGKRRIIQRNLGPVKGCSEKDAKRKLAKEIEAYKPSNKMSFSAAGARYVELRGPGWGKAENRTVRSILNFQVYPHLGDMPVGDIKPSHVQTALNKIAVNGSESTVIKAQSHIGGILEMLVADEILNRNAARNANVKKPKTRPVKKETLTLGQVQSLLAAATDERDRLLLMILFSCAFRPSEVFALRLNDARDGKLFIDEVAVPTEKLRKEGKTPGSFAGVPISTDLDIEIRMYAAREMMQPDELLFPSELGTAMSHGNWKNRNLAALAKACDIKRVNFQIIRRTVATLAQEFGGPKDIQTILRHKNIHTTLGIYQQPIAESVSRTADNWSNALRGKAN